MTRTISLAIITTFFCLAMVDTIEFLWSATHLKYIPSFQLVDWFTTHLPFLLVNIAALVFLGVGALRGKRRQCISALFALAISTLLFNGFIWIRDGEPPLILQSLIGAL